MTQVDPRRLQRRFVTVLSLGQILGAVGTGTAFSMGTILAARLSGNPALGGLSTTAAMLGAAALSVPLASLAAKRGRRIALTTGLIIAGLGSILVILADLWGSFPLYLIAIAMVGVGTATNLQTRFAATDMAAPETRARDLSLVVWATTVGVVLGPNLASPGDAWGSSLGLPSLAGAFLFASIAYAAGILLYIIWLRPDPLLTARALREHTGTEQLATKRGFGAAGAVLRSNPRAAVAVISIALAHAVMVGVMAMTPVHLEMMTIALPLIGLTISLHTAGMYALSPVFGWMADRWGRLSVVLIGQAVLALSLVVNALGPEDMTAIMIALILLGLGWSAVTVSASAWLTEVVRAEDRTTVQGFSDSAMSFAGAIYSALAGIILGIMGYGGLNIITLVLVIIPVVLVSVILLNRRGSSA